MSRPETDRATGADASWIVLGFLIGVVLIVAGDGWVRWRRG